MRSLDGLPKIGADLFNKCQNLGPASLVLGLNSLWHVFVFFDPARLHADSRLKELAPFIVFFVGFDHFLVSVDAVE